MRSIGSNRSRIQSNKRSIYDCLLCKKEYLRFHNTGKYRVSQFSKETVKSPVRWKWNGNIESAVMGDEKVIVEVINKIRNHGKAFTFHDNKGTDHGMV